MTIDLRKITINDSEIIVKWRNSPSVKENLYSQDDLTIEQHINYFHKYIDAGLIHQFIIIVDDIPCGTSFLKNIDLASKRAEFGIFIGESSYRGKGVGKAVTKKTIEYGFKELDLKSIYLTVLKNNITALRSYETVGFKVTKTIHDGYSRNGVFFDVVEMEINTNDY